MTCIQIFWIKSSNTNQKGSLFSNSWKSEVVHAILLDNLSWKEEAPFQLKGAFKKRTGI